MRTAFTRAVVVVLASAGLLAGASAASASSDQDQACWGQASAVFAQLGEMGSHSATQATPRLGLKNLAEALYADGIIDEPTMAALGAFVATASGLSIDACL